MAEIYLGNIKGPEGKTGPKGETGNGIKNITKTSSEGLIDTYTIEYTDGNTTTFDVKNGEVSQEQLDVVDNRSIDTRNELERVKNEVLETGTESDTYIHLEDSAMSEYQELEVDGVCKQTTTTGKNLAGYNSSLPFTNFGLTLSKTNDEYNITGTSNNWFYKSVYTIPAGSLNGTYTLSKINVSGTNKVSIRLMDRTVSPTVIVKGDVTTNASFTISSSHNDLELEIATDNSSNYNETFKIQLEKGIATEYEPYTNGIATPNPEYPQPIEVLEGSLEVTSCNKNLFDKENYTTINGVLGFDMSNIISGKTYTFTSSTPIRVKIATSHSGASIVDTTNEVSTLRFLPKFNGTQYIFFKLGDIWLNDIALIEGFNMQLEEGEATSFEEHLQSQITANIPEGEFIGKIDNNAKDTLEVRYNEEDGNYHLVLNKLIGKTILDGSGNYTIVTTSKGYRFHKVIKDLKNNINAKTIAPLKSSHFKAITPDGTFTGIVGISSNTTNNVLLICMGENSSITTVEDLKTWLSNNNVELYYALATPYEIDLGIVDQLLSYDKVSNVFTNSDLLPNINVKYYRNFEKTIQNLQVNEKALKQELIDINSRLSALENSLVNAESEVVE